MKTFLPVDTTVAWEVSADPGEWPTYTNTTRYFLLNEISMREGTWAIVRLGAHYFSSFEVSPLFDEGQNLIFNSGRFFLLKHAG